MAAMESRTDISLMESSLPAFGTLILLRMGRLVARALGARETLGAKLWLLPSNLLMNFDGYMVSN